jgi:hypothetical protein
MATAWPAARSIENELLLLLLLLLPCITRIDPKSAACITETPH